MPVVEMFEKPAEGFDVLREDYKVYKPSVCLQQLDSY